MERWQLHRESCNAPDGRIVGVDWRDSAALQPPNQPLRRAQESGSRRPEARARRQRSHPADRSDDVARRLRRFRRRHRKSRRRGESEGAGYRRDVRSRRHPRPGTSPNCSAPKSWSSPAIAATRRRRARRRRSCPGWRGFCASNHYALGAASVDPPRAQPCIPWRNFSRSSGVIFSQRSARRRPR